MMMSGTSDAALLGRWVRSNDGLDGFCVGRIVDFDTHRGKNTHFVRYMNGEGAWEDFKGNISIELLPEGYDGHAEVRKNASKGDEKKRTEVSSEADREEASQMTDYAFAPCASRSTRKRPRSPDVDVNTTNKRGCSGAGIYRWVRTDYGRDGHFLGQIIGYDGYRSPKPFLVRYTDDEDLWEDVDGDSDIELLPADFVGHGVSLNHAPNVKEKKEEREGGDAVVDEDVRSAAKADNVEVPSASRGSGRRSQFTGVTWCKKSKKWRAQITINKKLTFLGFFVNEVSAARAYDAAVIKHTLQRSTNFSYVTEKPAVVVPPSKKPKLIRRRV